MKNNTKTNYTIPALFLLLMLFGLTVLNLILPKKDYIDSERRPSAKMPEFNKETIFDEKLRARFEQRVADACAYGRKTGKPMFVTETCWGALTDEDRVEVIKYTLGILKKHDLRLFLNFLELNLY